MNASNQPIVSRHYEFVRRHAYRGILLLAAAATGKALSDGNLSAPIGCGILVVIAAFAIWGAIKQVIRNFHSR